MSVSLQPKTQVKMIKSAIITFKESLTIDGIVNQSSLPPETRNNFLFPQVGWYLSLRQLY